MNDTRPVFHLANGLYFRQESNGDVTIIKRSSGLVDAPILFEQTCDEGGWVSAVLSMTAFSERSGDFPAFEKHHLGKADLFAPKAVP
jgi:hypothetical protein